MMDLMKIRRALAAAIVAAGLTATPAFADATLFLGASTTPANRVVTGGSIGVSLLIVGFEFEYSHATEDQSASAPALTTGSVNALLQTPGDFAGFQPYVTAGIGVLRETLGSSHEDTSVGPNLGAGVKIALLGPLRLRVDYRVFRPGSGALYSPAHRFYAGLNLRF